jgi:hypothetical protein
VTVNSTVALTKISEKEILAAMNQYGIFNADVVIHKDISIDEFIDALEANRAYINAVYVLTKSDLVRELPRLRFEYVPVSAEDGKSIERLKKAIFDKLALIRIFTKRKGEKADLEEPMVVRKGTTIGEVCEKLHRDLRKEFRYALVWGKSVKHQPQRVGLEHTVMDGDIVQIIKR